MLVVCDTIADRFVQAPSAPLQKARVRGPYRESRGMEETRLTWRDETQARRHPNTVRAGSVVSSKPIILREYAFRLCEVCVPVDVCSQRSFLGGSEPSPFGDGWTSDVRKEPVSASEERKEGDCQWECVKRPMNGEGEIVSDCSAEGWSCCWSSGRRVHGRAAIHRKRRARSLGMLASPRPAFIAHHA